MTAAAIVVCRLQRGVVESLLSGEVMVFLVAMFGVVFSRNVFGRVGELSRTTLNYDTL